MVAREGKQYASKLAMTCSDGSLVLDPVTSYLGVVRNASGTAVSAPPCGQTGTAQLGRPALPAHLPAAL